jgi:hypothetical protein
LAVLFRRKHCAFKDYTWEYGWNEARAADGPRLDDEKLLEHVMGARESSVLLSKEGADLRHIQRGHRYQSS